VSAKLSVCMDTTLVNLSRFQTPVKFLFGMLFGVTIFLLQQTDKLVSFAPDLFQVIIGEAH
jgi:hypothetical protein